MAVLQNELPLFIQEITSLSVFKRAIKNGPDLLCLIVDVRTDGRTDIFTGFIRSSRRR